MVHAPVTGPELQARALLPPPELALGLASVRSAGDWYFSEQWLDELKTRVRQRLHERAEREPLDPGLLARPAPAQHAVGERDRAAARARAPRRQGLPARHALRRSAIARRTRVASRRSVAASGFGKADDRELAAFLESAGRLYRVGDGFAVSRELYERGTETIQTLAPITLAGFRDALGVSRRVAQLLLERYDADGLTRRVGDERVLRRAARR